MTQESCKVEYFIMLLMSKEEEKDQEKRYFERHFNSEEERNRVLSKAVAVYYDKMVALANSKEKDHSKTSDEFLDVRVEALLEKNQLIRRLPTMSSSNPNVQLCDLLSGVGSFAEIPLKVRQFLAAKLVWPDRFCIISIFYSLPSFLSLFHDKFEVFKESLVGISPGLMARACVSIVFGIDSTKLAVEDQCKLFRSINLLFSGNQLVETACSLYNHLSTDSSISRIFNVIQEEHQVLNDVVYKAFSLSPEYTFANCCMKKLKRSSFSFNQVSLDQYLLFNNVFLKKHQISLDERLVLLESCEIKHLLEYLPHNLVDLDVQALIQWINKRPDQKASHSFESLVILYSLDCDKDSSCSHLESLSSLWKTKSNWSLNLKIVLGTSFGRYLTHRKKIALLKHLCSGKLVDDLDAVLDNGHDDRKTFIAKIAFVFANHGRIDLVEYFSDFDFSLLVEACLDCPERYKIPSIYLRNNQYNVRILSKYIGNDLKNMAILQNLSEYFQVMTFLLTSHDMVAECLSKSKYFKHVCWEEYYFNAHWNREEAARAAKRIHEYKSRQSQEPTTRSS